MHHQLSFNLASHFFLYYHIGVCSWILHLWLRLSWISAVSGLIAEAVFVLFLSVASGWSNTESKSKAIIQGKFKMSRDKSN